MPGWGLGEQLNSTRPRPISSLRSVECGLPYRFFHFRAVKVVRLRRLHLHGTTPFPPRCSTRLPRHSVHRLTYRPGERASPKRAESIPDDYR